MSDWSTAPQRLPFSAERRGDGSFRLHPYLVEKREGGRVKERTRGGKPLPAGISEKPFLKARSHKGTGVQPFKVSGKKGMMGYQDVDIEW